jgi:hypothetical protein
MQPTLPPAAAPPARAPPLFRSTAADAAPRQTAVAVLVRELSLHSAAEERYLYPLITRKLDPKSAARALYDHLARMDDQVGFLPIPFHLA